MNWACCYRKTFAATVFRSSVITLISLSLQAQDRTFSCPAYGGGSLPIQWLPEYSAYIPIDHLSGVTSCSGSYGSVTKIYKGDGNADIGDGWPVQSARTYQGYNFCGSFNNGVQSNDGYQSDLFNAVGQMRNYGVGSPANGSTLSDADEDNVQYDCYLWNDAGYADESNMNGDLNITGPTGESGNAHFYGTASNPLESSVARIAWDMRVTMDWSDPNNAQVTDVNYNHTCFPSHIIKVTEYTVYYWGPPRADATYVAGCLVFQQGKIIGDTQPNKQVPCM